LVGGKHRPKIAAVPVVEFAKVAGFADDVGKRCECEQDKQKNLGEFSQINTKGQGRLEIPSGPLREPHSHDFKHDEQRRDDNPAIPFHRLAGPDQPVERHDDVGER